MHLTTNRTLLASIGLAALGLTAIASVQSSAQPTPPPVQLQKWIQSVPNRAMAPCPLTAAAGTAEVPYFGFAPGIAMQSCLLDGPYDWDGKKWYIQRMQGVNTPPREVVRVCSPSAVRTDASIFVAGPCRTTKGAGPRGCEICRVAGVPEK